MSQVNFADLLGKPFVNEGRGPEEYDCYGLAREVFGRFGIKLPDYRISCENASSINSTIDTEKVSTWQECEDSQVPSLLVMRFNSHLYNHVGVYIGSGRFIHTAEKTGVRIENINSLYWQHRIEGYYIPRR
ncbi:NlpC/P60 family protein [Halocella sp. SP3-1]|uniref:C40 family peptidase n=1 Tax=Halocella sp. SP3-1 TaxID=2382161 RepID=UPI000F764DD1|nr:NlpC/P60 family protein [Halocella sp. SP3-1]AZO96083.1 glycoside hydrolase [Halocella sp. SP3-1]